MIIRTEPKEGRPRQVCITQYDDTVPAKLLVTLQDGTDYTFEAPSMEGEAR